MEFVKVWTSTFWRTAALKASALAEIAREKQSSKDILEVIVIVGSSLFKNLILVSPKGIHKSS